MIVRQYAPCSLGRSIICLGKQGEINALRVEFDVSAWMAMYPDATVKLMHFAPDRPQDNPVIPTLGVEGTLRVWIVGEEDTAGAGNGVIELLLIDERTGSTIKSATGYTTVLRSPSAGIEAQEPEPGYVRYDVDQSALLTDTQKAFARTNIDAIKDEKDPTVPDWAKQPRKPTYTASEVGALPSSYTPPVTSVNGMTGAVALSAQDVGARPDTWTPSASEVGADAAGTASGAVAAHNVSGAAHADLRALIEGLNSRLNALADSDDTTLDQLSEIVAYIKSNRTLIDAVTTGKVSASDIVDNLTTNASGKVLSAAQGVALKAMIDGIVIPSALPNPQPITINGQRYDGSEAVTVTTAEIDDTLTQSGKAADAKAVGDRLSALNEANATQDELLNQLKSDINNLNASLNIENPAKGSLLIVKAYDESTPVISGLKIESNISYSFTFSIDEVLNIPVYLYLRKSNGESVTKSGIAQIVAGEKEVIVSKTYSENIENAYISAQCGNAGIGKTITASVEKTIKSPTKIEEFSRAITILKSTSDRIDNDIKSNSFVSGMEELDFNILSGSYIRNDGTIGKADAAYCVSDMVKVNPGERYVVKACSGYGGIIVAFYDKNKNYINQPLIGTEPSLSSTAIENQLDMIEIGISYDVAYIRISCNSTVFDGKIYRITDVIFVENTKNIEAETTQEIPTIFSSGKRIIPLDDPKGEAGEIADTSNATDVVSNFIPVNGGDLYTITATAGYGNLVYAFYDENKKYIDGQASVKGYSSRNCILCNTIIRIPGFGKHYLVVSSNTNVIDAKIGKILSIKTKKTIDSFLNLPAKFLSISYSSIWIAPINTLETYITAWKLGFNCCKGDVQPTSDGKLIMCHDNGFTFDSDGRITNYNPNNSTPIHSLTYSDCMKKEYSLSVSSNTNDHYSKVADIDGYLTICREYGMLALITIRNEYLDIVVPEVLSKIKKYNLEGKTILNTYDDKTIVKIRELDTNVLVSKILANDTPVKVENIDGAVNIGNCIVTAVLNYSDSADRIDYLVSDDITRYAAEKNVGIIIAGINTRDKTNKCISKGILGAQINKPVVQYDMRQYPFTVTIRDGSVSVMTFLVGNVETFSATISVADNTISISDFKESGSHRGFSDLIMPMWMNTFPYRIFAISKNGKKVAAQWKDNALIIEVEDINVNDTIIGFVEV